MNILPGTFDHNRPTMAINVTTGERRIVNVFPWSENARYYIDNEGTYYSAQDCRDIGRGHWILVNYRVEQDSTRDELRSKYQNAIRAREAAYTAWKSAPPYDAADALAVYKEAREAELVARGAYEDADL